MKVQNHKLTRTDGSPVPYLPSPNVGGTLTRPRWLVMHYTAGRSAKESIDWLRNPQAKASAHLVIARDGSITQLVPFNVAAWHAGKSAWKGVPGLNQHSIGIELDNMGKLTRKGASWVSWQGVRVPDPDVYVDRAGVGWHSYPAAQLAAARLAASAIVASYRLWDIIGHSDISPGRKDDPGPAFPMAEFRREVMEPPARPLASQVAKAIVDQRWNLRDTVSVAEVQQSAGLLLQLVQPAVDRQVPGAAEVQHALAGVLEFYRRQG